MQARTCMSIQKKGTIKNTGPVVSLLKRTKRVLAMYIYRRLLGVINTVRRFRINTHTCDAAEKSAEPESMAAARMPVIDFLSLFPAHNHFNT